MFSLRRLGSRLASANFSKRASARGFTGMSRCLPVGSRSPIHNTFSKMLIRQMSSAGPAFLSSTNGHYVDGMFEKWQQDPNSVHPSWDVYFRTGEFQPLPDSSFIGARTAVQSSEPSSSAAADTGAADDNIRLMQLVRAFQVRGHLNANLDPLGLTPPRSDTGELTLEYWGFTEADKSRQINIGKHIHDGVKGILGTSGPQTIGHIYDRLKDIYCNNIGYDYMHIPDVDQCNWIRERIETTHKETMSNGHKRQTYRRLVWADHFERFLASKFSTAKRFGLEGAEACIPGLKSMVWEASRYGMNDVVLGMPHRGRLNVLANVVKKPLESILAEFVGGVQESDDEDFSGSGDVKYHLGYSLSRTVGDPPRPVHLSLVANPSHLEAVNPVVLGKVRARQTLTTTKEDKFSHFGVLMHGDAAFAGQGIVMETLALNDLKDYSTGGTIHVVVNNQIGFTTSPNMSRSTQYCTDVAKGYNVPIFHVNGDDVESVIRVFELAAEWRATWHKDAVIDMVCYRKHGHNEIDEPRFTQPLMYQIIDKHPSVLTQYTEQLISEGSMTAEECEAISKQVKADLEQALEAGKHYEKPPSDWLHSRWGGLVTPTQPSPKQITGVDIDTLRDIGQKICSYPESFKIHRRLKGIYDKKKKTIDQEDGLDWATAEALAFGSLLCEGATVRLSGQDVERGTFSHRHAVLHDQATDDTWEPLNNLTPEQARFQVSNSNLSEFGVLGFELGYSMESPHQLVLWEAQFGDFANGAQIIMDQFISSQEEKWLRQSGLVLLLPHGYEGQGPEHSSARLERYLQGTNDHPDEIVEDNMMVQSCNYQVINCTTPANYFHVLRRQLNRQFRKPLIVMSPKLLLRHPRARSSLAEMSGNTVFRRVLPEETAEIVDNASNVRKVIFCSGKVYYDLLEKRENDGANDVALVRLEQISPFPFQSVQEAASTFPDDAELVWCQEEPMNMGAWTFVEPRIETALGRRAEYVGRAPSASTSTGSLAVHNKELAKFLEEAYE